MNDLKAKKEFDAVAMMRSIRERLHEKFEADPTLRRKKLAAIRKKYRFKKRQKMGVTAA